MLSAPARGAGRAGPFSRWKAARARRHGYALARAKRLIRFQCIVDPGAVLGSRFPALPRGACERTLTQWNQWKEQEAVATPNPPRDPGELTRADLESIPIPGLIKEMKEEWRGMCKEAYKEGYLNGAAVSSAKYKTGDTVQVVEYILQSRGVPPDVISDAVNALREILPRELQQ